tara:strand:- start:2769 stop:3653 length:885 start_codon:yes stop_codon:yes gene_type:complete
MGNICFFGCVSNRVTTHEIKPFKYDIEQNFDIEIFNPINLGNGVSSETFKISMDNLNLTCKKIKKKYKSDFQNEIKVLREMQEQSYFPTFHNAIEDKDFYYILYDYIEGIDLYTMLQSKKIDYTDIKILAHIIRQITLGLKQFFKFNYVHLDLKLENIIINPKPPYNIKIIDVAFAKKIDSGVNKICILGTESYISPEVLLYNRYFHNTDVWSLGIIIYILITKNHLFLPTDDYSFLEQMKDYTNLRKFSPKYFKIKEKDNDLCDLLSKMLVKNQPFRIPIKGILKHKFLVDNI